MPVDHVVSGGRYRPKLSNDNQGVASCGKPKSCSAGRVIHIQIESSELNILIK